MTLWPRHDRGGLATDGSLPFQWTNFSALTGEAKHAPAVDLAAAPEGQAAPPPPVEAVPFRPASRARSDRGSRLWAVLALLASTGLHAAALAFFLDRMSRAGVEAETDAVSVRIVLEAPPEPVVAASGAAEPAEPVEPATVEAAVAETVQEEPVEDRSTEIEAAKLPAEEPAAIEHAAEARRPRTSEPVESPPAISVTRAPTEELTPPLMPAAPAALNPEEQATEPPPPKKEEEAVAAMPTPEAGIPLPSPRPAYTPPKAKPPAEKKAVAGAEPAKPAARKPAKAQAKASGSKQAEIARSPASTAGSIAARGGANAGEKAKYGQKLLSHVERHKRYPEVAARQRLAGATKLAITIDRAGRLASARVAGGSGHAILDEAALEAARRAAPYPRPPEGIGGGTFSFAVTMRFKR